jgi:hypothetical protein
VPSHLFTGATRCHVFIIAENMEDIDLQVERDVTHMHYTCSGSRTELECIIFTVSLNRPASWAQNGGKFNLQTLFSSLHHLQSVSTWNGKIGIQFDSVHPPWSQKIYHQLLTSLSSCFYPRDISPQTCVASIDPLPNILS